MQAISVFTGLPPGTSLWFLSYYFHIFALFIYISNLHASTLASGTFAEAGP